MTQILLGKDSQNRPISLELKMANRHGLIAGATGTGKTVTLQRLAEGFAREGVSVFMADVKGDLSGLAAPGQPGGKIQARIEELKLEYQPRAYPTIFWDIYGQKGHPLRSTVSEMGPLLLGRVLDLNDTQEGVMQVVFKVADDNGLLLLDLKDMQAMLSFASDQAKELKSDYGNLSPQSLGTIQRQLLVLGESGGEIFFGEPAIRLENLMQKDFSGNGVISILDSQRLMQDSKVYTSFMLWLLSELFEQLPEVGDLEKPKLVFFFDEAHLLFNGAPKALLEKIEQVVRLIRSKGVGIYFITQNPMDIPESVLGQLGNRVQHALRAFTPGDQKAVKVAAQTFRQNPEIDTEKAITELGVGEALVSLLDLEGRPAPVERVKIAPPESRVGPLNDAERAEKISRSPLAGVYDKLVDRDSAYELLKKRQEEAAQAQSQADDAKAEQKGKPRP
ncbi:MAG TPA: helicase HerA-like domain-containing protein, partial [bacterium]|nr:helicase HerA-like domain-containing protein [bacterium]